MKISLRLLALSSCVCLSTPAASQMGPHFEDRSDQYGVLFEHQLGNFAYQMGGGVAWIDFDVDGDDDLVTVSSDGHNGTFENKGDGSFEDVSLTSGLFLSEVSNSIGVSVADYNQDGLPDLYLTNAGPNMLFQNNGDGSFTDMAPALGLAGERWSAVSAWSDFDGDGDLDLYVGNYVDGLNFPYHFGWANELFQNQGTPASPNFVDVAPRAGVDNTSIFGESVPGHPYVAPTGQSTAGCTLSICTLDYDEDGDPDLMIGNDFGEFVVANTMYRNDTSPGGALKFTDVSDETGFNTRPHYNMGVSASDYDLDGDWDFYNTNLGDNLLLRNDDGVFVDETYSAGPVDGVNAEGTLLIASWGILWSDFDNDRHEDLFVCNGLIPAAGFIENDPNAPNSVFMNQQDGSFARLSDLESGCGDTGAGRGVAWSDVNRDGLVDFYTMNNGSPWVVQPGDACRLWINAGTLGDPTNGWMELRFHAWQGNHEAIGTRVVAEIDGDVLRRQLLADPVFVSSSSRMVHLGMGQADMVDRLVVDWPMGIRQELHRVPKNQLFDLREPRVTVDSLPPVKYEGGALHLGSGVTNHTDQPQQLKALMFFYLGADGPLLGVIPLQYTLDPNQHATLSLPLPIDAATHSALQGLEIERLVYVLADGAADSREELFRVP